MKCKVISTERIASCPTLCRHRYMLCLQHHPHKNQHLMTIHNTQATDYVANTEYLVCLPEACQRVNQLIDLPSTTVHTLADVISLDPAMSAMLLKLTNSAYFGFSQPITTISHAISVIGKNDLRSLVLSSGAVDSLESLANEFMEMSEFWHHSIYTGLLARALSAYLSDLNKEEMFISGMLHDVGKLVIFNQSPDIARELINKGITSSRWVKLEKQRLGFTHADVGYELAKSWGLPEMYCDCILLHHDIKGETKFKLAKRVIITANRIAEIIDNDHAEENVDEVYEKLKCKARLGLTFEQVKQSICVANEQAFGVMETIYPGSTLIF